MQAPEPGKQIHPSQSQHRLELARLVRILRRSYLVVPYFASAAERIDHSFGPAASHEEP